MSAEPIIATTVIKYGTYFVSGLCVLIAGVFSYIAKALHAKLKEHDDEMNKQAKDIISLRQTVESELKHVSTMVDTVSKKLDALSDQLIKVIIESGIRNGTNK